MEERRVYGRVEPAKEMSCQVMDSEERLPDSFKGGRVRDICPGGISLWLEEPLIKDEIVRLSITFPFSLPQEPGNALGRVVHCFKDNQSQRYVAGIAYIRKNKLH